MKASVFAVQGPGSSRPSEAKVKMPLSATTEYDAIVIGGGIIGSCTAYSFAANKQNVLLLEQFSFLHKRGSSHGESRIIRKTYPEVRKWNLCFFQRCHSIMSPFLLKDFYTQMMTEAYQRWDNAQHEAGYKVCL